MRSANIILVLLGACSFQTLPGSGSGSGSNVELTVTANGPANAGKIDSLDGAIHCSATSTLECAASYPAGTQITLDATLSTGYALQANWPGCPGGGASCAFTITSDMTVDATFSLVSYAFDVTSNHGTVQSSDAVVSCTDSTCNYTYAFGSTFTLTVQNVDANYTFDRWNGGPCNGMSQTTCPVTMQAGAMSVQALYRNNSTGGDD